MMVRIRCSRRRVVVASLVTAAMIIIAMLSGPAATALQARHRLADPRRDWDAIYLVCGAQAQSRRMAALTHWVAGAPSPPDWILVGNDSQRSFWSAEHQRNLTRAEWSVRELREWKDRVGIAPDSPPRIRALTGHFGNTDAEMQTLGTFLRREPAFRRLAIVTCRFHTLRAINRLEAHAPAGCVIAAIPGTPHWKDRAPWIVALEYLKRVRDALGYSQVPFLSRPPPESSVP